MGFGDTELPREARVLDRREGRSTRAAVVTANEDVIGMRLGHAGSNRADTHLAHQLDADARRRIGVLQVVNQLCQVLDRIDVVVRRWADQSDAGRRMPHRRDFLVDLSTGKLPTLARLGPLRHLDLDLVAVGQVVDGHAETTRSDLLDRRSHGVR